MPGVILLVERSVDFAALTEVVATVDVGRLLRRFEHVLQWFDSDECVVTLGELDDTRDMLEEEYEEDAPGKLVWQDWRFFDLNYRDAEAATRILKAVLDAHPKSFVDLYELGGGLLSAEDFLAQCQKGCPLT